MTRIALASMALATTALLPGLAFAQLCDVEDIDFVFSQPPAIDPDDEDSLRWPVDGTIRVGYTGSWCPTEDDFEIIDGAGQNIPAVVRIRTPQLIVEEESPPVTVMDIRPVDPLERRTLYTLRVQRPTGNPFELQFKTNATELGEFPVDDFPGALLAERNGDRCDFVEGQFRFAGTDVLPGCEPPGRLVLQVQYEPIDNPNVTYAVYRVSSTPLDIETREPLTAEADDTDILLAFESGATDRIGTGLTRRSSRVRVNYNPLPREDCFAVVMIDEWGRTRGSLDNAVCVELDILEPCPMAPPFPEADAKADHPQPYDGQECGNLGLYGADPNAPIPELPMEGGDGAGGADGAGGSSDGMGGRDGAGGSADSDAGADGGGSDGEGGGSSSGCAALGDGPSGVLPLALLLLLGGLRRRR